VTLISGFLMSSLTVELTSDRSFTWFIVMWAERGSASSLSLVSYFWPKVRYLSYGLSFCGT
jgi:hypothetical protein